MATPLPANVNLIQLLAAAPATTFVGTEPFETVQSGTSVAGTLNQLVSFAQANFTVPGLSVLGVAGTASGAVGGITGVADQALVVNHAATGLAFGPLNLSAAAAVTGNLPIGNLITLAGLSVLGVTGTATGTMAAITGTADQVLVVNHAATGLLFGPLNLATSAAVTGVLPTANGGIGTSSLGQIPGSTTNDSASAGNVGEYTSVNVGSVNLTTTVQRSIATISLTPGDWRVEGIVGFHFGTASFTSIGGGVTQTAGVLPSVGNFGVFQLGQNLNTAPVDAAFPTGAVRVSLATTSNFYLVAVAGFTTAALAAYGAIEAWRVR